MDPQNDDEQKAREFDASPLGTKEYWDNLYKTELRNFNDSGEEGTVWFGKVAETRILRFMNADVVKSARVIDIGCGNGSLLRKLRKNGFTNLAGIDYSENAIELARQSTSTDDDDNDAEKCLINYQIADLTANELDPLIKGKFDVVTDKGTWDAMSLAKDQPKMLQDYRRSVEQLFDIGASDKRYFVIISCNFTVDELKEQFSSDRLIFNEELPAQQSFTFGGRTGQTTSGAVFKFIN